MMNNHKAYLVFDIESSDLWHKDLSNHHVNQAWIVQFAGSYLNSKLETINSLGTIMTPPYVASKITPEAFTVHGISIDMCYDKGMSINNLRRYLQPAFNGDVKLVAHNLKFDKRFLFALTRHKHEVNGLIESLIGGICTMESSKNYIKLPPTEKMKPYKHLRYKNPRLEELYEFLFNEKFTDAHNAETDCAATKKCFKELVKRNIIKIK